MKPIKANMETIKSVRPCLDEKVVDVEADRDEGF